MLIVSARGGYEGFFIDSGVSHSIRNKPELLPCVAPISAEENRFLSHHSYVTCNILHSYEARELTDKLGSLSPPSRKSVKRASQKCPALERGQKIRINDDT